MPLNKKERKKRNKLWRDMEETSMRIPKWRSPYVKATHCMIPIRWHSGNGKTKETPKRSMVARALGAKKGKKKKKKKKGVAQRIFKALTLFWIRLWWWTQAITHSSKPTEIQEQNQTQQIRWTLGDNFFLKHILGCTQQNLKAKSHWSLHSWSSGLPPKFENKQCRRHRFDSWVGKIPWRRKWQPTPGFLPGESQGRGSLAGYCPWGSKSRTWLSD